jgi:hypothetical protein
MRSILLAILILSAVPAVHSAPPTSSLLFQLSPDSGGAQTLISWTLSGPIKDSFALSGGSWTGIGSLFDGAFNSSYFTDSSAETFAVAGAGSFNDLTAATSVQVTQIGIGAFGSSRYIALFWGGTSFAVAGNQVQYTAGADSSVINVPFSAFNVGTYTATGMNLQGGMNFSATVVPEPSALSLLAVGLGGLALRRLRRTL